MDIRPAAYSYVSTDASSILEVALPEVEKTDISVRLDPATRVLHIVGDIFALDCDTGLRIPLVSYHQQIPLTPLVDLDSITMHLVEKGLIAIHIPFHQRSNCPSFKTTLAF